MPHQRTLIRQKVRELLLGQTAAQDRVYTTRVRPLSKERLPAISVWTLDDTVDDDSAQTAPRELTRNLRLVIEGWVAGSSPDDAMDALAIQIEAVMDANRYLQDTVADSILDETDMEVVETGDRMMGLLILIYAVTYRTETPAAAGLDDFEVAGATYDLAGLQHPDDQTQDEITVEESP